MANKTNKSQNELGGIKALTAFKIQTVLPSIQHAKEIKAKLDNLTSSVLEIKAKKLAEIENLKLAEEKKLQAEAEIKQASQVKLDENIATVKDVVDDSIITDKVDEKLEELIPDKTKDTEKVTKASESLTSKKDKGVDVEVKSKVEAKPQTQNIQTRIFDQKQQKGNRDARPQQQHRPTGQQNYNRQGGTQQSGSRQFTNQQTSNAQRPSNYQQGGAQKRDSGKFIDSTPMPSANKFSNKNTQRKSSQQQQADERRTQNKRALIRKGFIVTDPIIVDEENYGGRHIKRPKSKRNEFIQPTAKKIESAVITTEFISIKALSEKIGKTGSEILKQLMLLNILKTINDVIDFDTADLVAGELGIKLEYVPEKTAEDILQDIETESDIKDENSIERSPIVTIMGHVDHGKTSLLDYIRKESVASGEAGGITQHIGAYTVALKEKQITFLDTPGHEAFTSMRMRGAQVTDIAIIVVAADDGVMPQTVEAINHAKMAGVSIIIAVNKIDKNSAQPEKVLQQLTNYEIIPEEWGGDTPVVYVSAKTGENINSLLETILVVAELLELKANPERKARGTIVEAKLDKGKGPMATVLVQNGTLNIGDVVVAGISSGKIRAMIDDKGNNIKKAGPATPVAVLGFSEVPNAGDSIMVVSDERFARQVVEERQEKVRAEMNIIKPTASLEDIFAQIKTGETKSLNIIIKADVQGSVEAVKQALVKLSNEEVKISIIHGGVGAVNESDVMLASTSSAVIIGFNVRADSNAKACAERDKIDIRLYRIIYDAIDDVEKAIKGMLAPKFKETNIGSAEIRQVYNISGIGSIAGAYVTDGKLARNAKIRLYRNDSFVYEGELNSLKRFKDDVKEVARGYECGFGILNYNDIKEGDVIEAFVMEVVNE